ncbi:MAG: 30S ribosomal protein S17 [candidate division Zixibacteria bacterium]|nr:30S ribosomal protein S17 [candidate division Zixibacteria bacterium]
MTATVNKETAEARPIIRGRRKTREGIVVSDKMSKTIVVKLERRFKHPLYGKIVSATSKLYAHDEEGKAGVGDKVKVVETRPLSKLKRWRLTEVLEKAK